MDEGRARFLTVPAPGRRAVASLTGQPGTGPGASSGLAPSVAWASGGSAGGVYQSFGVRRRVYLGGEIHP
jgi:hypothetical protein